MHLNTLALLVIILPTLLHAHTIAESSALERLFDRLAHRRERAAHRSTFAFSIASVPQGLTTPINESPPAVEDLNPPTPKLLRLKRLATEDEPSSEGLEHKKRWIWATYIIQDSSPTSGLPPLGQNANLLSYPSTISTPSATFVAPTFPALGGVETSTASASSSLAPAPTESSPSSTDPIASGNSTIESSVLPLTSDTPRRLFIAGSSRRVPTSEPDVPRRFVETTRDLFNSHLTPNATLVAPTFPSRPNYTPSGTPSVQLLLPRAHMQRVKRFKVEQAPVA